MSPRQATPAVAAHASCISASCSRDGKFQLRGAEIGGGPRPIGFLGRRLPM